MKIQNRMEKNIDETECKLGLSSRPSQTGKFLELGYNMSPNSTDSPANRAQRKLIDDVRVDFGDAVSNCLHGEIPFSFLACVLTLPENIEEWPNLATFRKVLLGLLSDQGFLFWEVCPTTGGSILDCVGMLDKNKQNTIRSQEIWTDTKMISRLLEKLEALYREVLQPESVLIDLERSAAQPDLFHHCIAYIVETELQKGPAVKEPAYYENILVKFCKDMLHLTEEQLYAYVHIDDILIPRYDDKELNSISGALAELSILCHKLADEVNHQRLWLSHTANQETYKRYKDYCSTREKLDSELQRTPQLRYSSKHLLTDIADELTDWYQHVDTIKRDNLKHAKELGESPCNEDQQVRINKKVAPDKAKGLPRHFNFEWITSEIEQLEKQNCTELQNRLLHIVRQYLFKCEAPEEVKPNKLKEYINQILALSFMEIFSLSCENTSDSIEDILVTLAPVISYTIIRHGLRQIAAGKELQLPMRVLISQVETAENPNDISADLCLFLELCSAYGKYYGKQYTKTVQNLWDAAFLVYSGYQKIYANPNLLRTVNVAEKSF